MSKRRKKVKPVQSELVFPKPKIIRVGGAGDLLGCPMCGHEDDIDNWDVLGADPDCLFCNGCGEECAC